MDVWSEIGLVEVRAVRATGLRTSEAESRMPFGLSRSRAPVIGVDFGAERLKLIQVFPGEPPQLIATAGVDLPDEVRDSPAARMAFFAETLPKLVRSQPFKGRRVILSMPAIHTVVQQLSGEVASDQSIDGQIEAELMQRLSLNPSRMLIRHHEVPVTGKGNEREFVCLAAPRDVVMQYIELARRSKLDVVGMYAEPLAILQAFDFMHRREGDEARAVGYIDIGSATTKVVISHGRQMVFAKALPLGGEHFAECADGPPSGIALTVDKYRRRPGHTQLPVAVIFHCVDAIEQFLIR